MANSRQMAQAISQVFDVPQVSAEVISRTLMENGLRAPGGRGRGAVAMTGRDIFNVAITVASGVGMRDAPAFVKCVEDMRLTGGDMHADDVPQWEAPSVKADGTFHWLMHLVKKPMVDIEVTPTFGPFISNWIDGLFDPTFAWKEAGELELRLSHNGPAAEFSFKDQRQALLLSYAAQGSLSQNKPDWERLTIIRGGVFRKFAQILSGD